MNNQLVTLAVRRVTAIHHYRNGITSSSSSSSIGRSISTIMTNATTSNSNNDKKTYHHHHHLPTSSRIGYLTNSSSSYFSTDNNNNKNKNNNSNKKDEKRIVVDGNTAVEGNNNNKKKRQQQRRKNKNKNSQGSRSSKKKENFAKTVLEPIAKGEIRRHSDGTGIPKLAGRGKSHSHQPLKQKGPNHNRATDLSDATVGTTTTEATSTSTSTTNLLRSGRKLKDVVQQYRRQQQKEQQSNNNKSKDNHSLLLQQQALLFEDNQDGTDPWDMDPLQALEQMPQATKEVDKETGKEIYVLSYTDQDFYDDLPHPSVSTTPPDSSDSSDSDSSDSDSDSDSDDEEYDGSLLYNEEGRNIRFEIGQNLKKRDMETGELLPGNPEEEYFLKDILDYTDPFPTTSLKVANQVLPLQETGHQVDDFMTAMYEHPTKYASISRIHTTTPHRRPYLPLTPHIHYPPPSFLTTDDTTDTSSKNPFKAFLYVTQLPNYSSEEFRMDDALAVNQVAEYVANLLQVPVTNVHTAHKHGAFVRFHTPQQAATIFHQSKTKRRTCHTTTSSDSNPSSSLLSLSLPTSNNILQISNVPSHLLSDTAHFELKQLLSTFFSSDSIVTITATSNGSNGDVEVQLAVDGEMDQKVVEGVVKSKEFQLEWEQFRSKHSKVGVFPCHRKRVFAGYTGPSKSQMYYEKDTQLDIQLSSALPSHVTTVRTQRQVSLQPDFYNSHAIVWLVDHLPLSITKSQISSWLQPHCTQRRDIHGSIQLIHDADGQFQGSAYIGFDTIRDAQTALTSFQTTTNTTNDNDDDDVDDDVDDSSNKVVNVRWENTSRMLSVVVLEDIMEGGKKRRPYVGPRSERTEDELWQVLDDQYMVDTYLTKDDLEFLTTHNIDVNVIKDAFMAARHGNVSYGMEDDGIVGERHSDDQSPGDGFRDFCQLYMETLREVVATPEDPGLTYRSMFMPDEPQDIDTIREDFAREHNRIQKLHQKHYPPPPTN